MTFKPAKHAPLIVAAVVILLLCFLQLLRLDFFERLEWFTYDQRVRVAARFPAPAATNLAFVAIQESSVDEVLRGDLGFHFGLLWPRQVYGRLVNELSAEGARAVGFDVLFAELRPDSPAVQMANGTLRESDDYFANEMKQAGNVTIAVTPQIYPPDLFVTNAFAMGDISTEKDSDGDLRRVRAFRMYRRWHPYIEMAASEFDLDLDRAKILPGEIVVPQHQSTNVVEIPVDAQTNFSSADFFGDTLPPGVQPHPRAYTDLRVWHMGIVLAAAQLGLDLNNAKIDLARGKIVLRGTNGVVRTIPVDSQGNFYVDWRMTPNDKRLLRMPIEDLLMQAKQRLKGQTNGLSDAFRDKLVMVGSAASGNNLTDRGATPLEHDTLLVSTHWNVANSIITNQFIHRLPMGGRLAMILMMGALTAFATLGFRSVIWGSAAVLLLILIYTAVAFVAFIHFYLWLPVFFPVIGAVLVQHLSLVTWRAVFEETEKQRVKSVFSKMVSPDVMSELLQAEKLSLGGARREVTVFFADVRGFTALTDDAKEQSAKFVQKHQLDANAAEALSNESARETLNTINTYLALVADTVITGGGTLDKYIGDCVMAFWGAPVANPKHSVGCVRAAIEAQRRIFHINQERRAENERRTAENTGRIASGKMERPLLPVLTLGCGINTGVVDVGLMGSLNRQYNYTVFGREVNLASRLEGVSGSARIIIGEATYSHLLRDDPSLAKTCIELPPVKVKGIVDAIKIYEVPWQEG